MVRDLGHALADAARAAEFGGELVEFRIDRFTDDPEALAQLVEQSALPCILTCRPTWEGGGFEGDDQLRISLLERACRGVRQPSYIDLELAAYQRSANMRRSIGRIVDQPGQRRPVSTGLILSAHDLVQRPRDLIRKLKAMADEPACRVIKVAWRARSLRDNLKAFEILQQQYKPTIALCMGEFGLASRVLAKKFGALVTFVALDQDAATAPGQPTLDEMKQRYRWDKLRADTAVYGVIGYPVAQSMGPAIHNAAFDAAGVNGVYLPLPIRPEYEQFKVTVTSWLDAAALHFRGASVTNPHKQNLLRYVQDRGGEIEPLAAQIGAANTLTIRGDSDGSQLYAANTDYGAALDAVCDGLAIGRDGLADRRVAVIGAGGAARAVVAGLVHHGATVVIYNRTIQNAEALAERFNGGPGKAVPARLEKLCDSCCELYINCTPVGMHPNVDETPVPTLAGGKGARGLATRGLIRGWGPGTVVFDTIYNPVETRLLRDARAAGCRVIPGAEMFVRQAAAQFELWTGHAAPMELFRSVLTRTIHEA